MWTSLTLLPLMTSVIIAYNGVIIATGFADGIEDRSGPGPAGSGLGPSVHTWFCGVHSAERTEKIAGRGYSPASHDFLIALDGGTELSPCPLQAWISPLTTLRRVRRALSRLASLEWCGMMRESLPPVVPSTLRAQSGAIRLHSSESIFYFCSWTFKFAHEDSTPVMNTLRN